MYTLHGSSTQLEVTCCTDIRAELIARVRTGTLQPLSVWCNFCTRLFCVKYISTVISVTMESSSMASSHVSVLFESQVILGSIQRGLRKGGRMKTYCDV